MRVITFIKLYVGSVPQSITLPTTNMVSLKIGVLFSFQTILEDKVYVMKLFHIERRLVENCYFF